MLEMFVYLPIYLGHRGCVQCQLHRDKVIKNYLHAVFNGKKTGTFLRVPVIKPGPEPTNAQETFKTQAP